MFIALFLSKCSLINYYYLIWFQVILIIAIIDLLILINKQSIIEQIWTVMIFNLLFTNTIKY